MTLQQYLGGDRVDKDMLFLCPLRNRDYLIVGDACKDKNPLRDKGTNVVYSYCIPLATEGSLMARVEARKQEYVKFKNISCARGVELETVQSQGLFTADGIGSNVYTGGMLSFSAVTHGGSKVWWGVSLVSGETGVNVTLSRSAFDDAAALLFPDDNSDAKWPVTDCGAAMIQSFGASKADCFAHLSVKDWERFGARMQHPATNSGRMLQDVLRLKRVLKCNRAGMWQVVEVK
jgi:hypothetical protein